jgi:PKD repeat protein
VGQIVTLTSTSTNAASLLWKITPTTYTLQNGSTLTSSVVYVSFDQTGAYTVELTATNPTGSNKKTQNNYINVSLIGANKPSTDFYADKTVAAIGETVSFFDQTGDNPQTFLWTFTPNTVTYLNGTNSASRFPKVSFNSAGKYTVKLTATNGNGGTDKIKTDYINVTAAGVADVVNSTLNLYPNPASNLLFVGLDFKTVTITDLTGKIQNVNVSHGLISVSDLKSGIYSVTAMDEKGLTFHGRFVKAQL